MPTLTSSTFFPAAAVERITDAPTERTGPLWAGPCGEGPLGGVTQSMIARYLACPERFRVANIEGWQAADRFAPALEYGNLWHAAEEAHAANGDWVKSVSDYAVGLFDKYPMQREAVEEWYQKCLAQFPVYADHWSQHPDMIERKPLMQEQKFDVAYELPSGRKVRLRGKFDSVDLVGDEVWLMENKTKSAVDQQKVQRQLRFDLQVQMYLIALRIMIEDEKPIVGVRYNVVRRSAHKSVASMMKKITEDRDAGRIEEWFARWNVRISERDLERFKLQCLNSVLENLCDDYEWWSSCMIGENVTAGCNIWDMRRRKEAFPGHCLHHYRYPYGTYSPVAEGGFGDVDEYLENGSTSGLRRVTTLFTELQ